MSNQKQAFAHMILWFSWFGKAVFSGPIGSKSIFGEWTWFCVEHPLDPTPGNRYGGRRGLSLYMGCKGRYVVDQDKPQKITKFHFA